MTPVGIRIALQTAAARKRNGFTSARYVWGTTHVINSTEPWLLPWSY